MRQRTEAAQRRRFLRSSCWFWADRQAGEYLIEIHVTSSDYLFPGLPISRLLFVLLLPFV